MKFGSNYDSIGPGFWFRRPVWTCVLRTTLCRSKFSKNLYFSRNTLYITNF